MHRFLAILALSAVCANAQSIRGTVLGSVVSDGGTAIAADVELKSSETGAVRSAVADSEGAFVFPLVPAGRYDIEVRKDGFRTWKQSFTLLVNQELRIDAVLPSGSRSDVVEVTATRSLLRTDSASLGSVIDTRFVQGLPLDGRNFLELSLLTPGTAPAAQGSAGSVRGDFALHVNGSREDGNAFLLDGVYNGDPKLNTFGLVSPVDAIREFEVATSTYEASFGRNGGGQVNVALKSGGNDFHGTVYEFFRDAKMDARNFFAPAAEPKPAYRRNQFGASVGGPVLRNRTFFFADYEGRRANEGITRASNVPTALERQGDFSQSGLQFLIDPFTQQPFPGSRIPASRLHPIGRGLANLYPLPNRSVPGQNFVSSPSQTDRNDQFDTRLDHKLSAASDLTFRYSFGDRLFVEPFAGASSTSIPGFGSDVPRRAQNLLLAETHAFSPTVLNEIRFGFSRVASSVLPVNRNGVTNAQVGLPVTSTKDRDLGLTQITVPGYSPLGDELNNPQESATNTFQIIDHATLVRSRHILKAGFEFRRLQQDAFRDVASRGFINFFGFTGNAMAELLQGLPVASGVARLDNPQFLRTSSYNLFVSDAWRATSRLTLNLGLRYEFNSPPVDKFDRANIYNPASGGLVPVGANGIPRSGYTADRNNIAPRVGFALALDGAQKTLLRGGYGVYFDQSSLAPGEGLYFSPPYFDFRLFVALAQFPILLHDPFPANYPFPVPGSATAFQRDLKTPYIQHFNLNLQRAVGSSGVLEVGYVGSKGTKLISARDINQPGPSADPQNLRPNPLFGDVNILESRASSNYHSLQARYQRRLSHGLSALASYTFGKSIDDASNFFASAGDPNFPQDSRNTRLERARSNFDVQQRFSLAYGWDLPLGKGLLRGGWQTFGVWTFQTGRPFTVALLPDLDNSGTGRSTLGFGSNDRPNVVGNGTLDNPAAERWFNTQAFAIPPRGQFGNAGRNILDGPGLATVNFSVLKNFALAEQTALQFRFEAFNLFDRVNLDLPDIYVGSPTFGRISSAQNPRRLQLGVKFLF